MRIRFHHPLLVSYGLLHLSEAYTRARNKLGRVTEFETAGLLSKVALVVVRAGGHPIITRDACRELKLPAAS
jgi:hypothetical protein